MANVNKVTQLINNFAFFPNEDNPRFINELTGTGQRHNDLLSQKVELKKVEIERINDKPKNKRNSIPKERERDVANVGAILLHLLRMLPPQEEEKGETTQNFPSPRILPRGMLSEPEGVKRGRWSWPLIGAI